MAQLVSSGVGHHLSFLVVNRVQLANSDLSVCVWSVEFHLLDLIRIGAWMRTQIWRFV